MRSILTYILLFFALSPAYSNFSDARYTKSDSITVNTYNFGGFPDEFIGEKIFDCALGWIKALYDTMFTRNSIESHIIDFSVI